MSSLKMRRDVEVIAGSGAGFEEVHVFCTANVPVARRHELQDWASATHGVRLEVYDRQAIAELLVERDVFWIAGQCLGVPSELFPPPGQTGSWYDEIRETLAQGDLAPPTFANFAKVKEAARHASTTPDLLADAPLWMAALASFESDEAPSPLRFRATYERAVVALKAFGTMEGLEGGLRRYFGAVPSFYRLADVEDASCLAVFCHQAFSGHGLAVGLDEVLAWRDAVVADVDRRFAGHLTPGERAQLLVVRGHLAMALRLGQEPGDDLVADAISEAVAHWGDAVELVADAPLFPVGRLADQLAQLAPMFGDDPGYAPVVARIDELVASRSGEAAVAGVARDRAMAFYKAGCLLRAVEDLHRARVGWFAHETLEGAVLAMVTIAQCYLDLGLAHAAKYYALAAAHRASGSDDPNVLRLLPPALFMAGDCDFAAGNWLGLLGTADLALTMHWQFARDAGDFDRNSVLAHVGRRAPLIVAIAERIDPTLASTMTELVSSWGSVSFLPELLPDLREDWAGLAPVAAASRAEASFGGRVLADLEPEREAAWEQLGITWRVRWTNTEETTRAVEQLIATMQIGLTDFAGDDLLLLPTEVRIAASTADVARATVDPSPSNDGRDWRVVLPATITEGSEATVERSRWTFGVAVGILREASLMPDKDFIAALERAALRSDLGNFLVGRSYEQLAADFAPRPDPFAGILLRPVPHSIPTPKAGSHPELQWVGGPGPGYTDDEATAMVARRYEHATATWAFTLARLRRSAGFRATVDELRGEGWKDWHLLLAIGNLAINYRLAALYGPFGAMDRDLARQVAFEPETADALEVPIEEFGTEAMRRALRGSMSSTLQGFGLEVHQETPDLTAVERFLGERYRYWDIDIEHPDPFAQDTANAPPSVSRHVSA